MDKPIWTRTSPTIFTTSWHTETFTLERHGRARWVAYRGEPTPAVDRRSDALAIATSIPKAQAEAALALNGWRYWPPLDPADGHPVYQRLGVRRRHEDLLEDLYYATTATSRIEDPLTWAVAAHPEVMARDDAPEPGPGYPGTVVRFRAPEDEVTGFVARRHATPLVADATPWRVATAYRRYGGGCLHGRADVHPVTGAQLKDAISYALAQTRAALAAA